MYFSTERDSCLYSAIQSFSVVKGRKLLINCSFNYTRLHVIWEHIYVSDLVVVISGILRSENGNQNRFLRNIGFYIIRLYIQFGYMLKNNIIFFIYFGSTTVQVNICIYHWRKLARVCRILLIVIKYVRMRAHIHRFLVIISEWAKILIVWLMVCLVWRGECYPMDHITVFM